MAYPATSKISPHDYLAMEINSTEKHEYFDGEVFSMAGAREVHNRIVANTISEIHMFLKGKDCSVYPSDLRVCTPLSDAYMYPDISIICGDIKMEDDKVDTVTNPSVIIEVMGATTKNTDRGHKFFRYLQIPSLKEYILINSMQYGIEVMRKRDNDNWHISKTTDKTSSLFIETIGLTLPLTDIYYQAAF